MIRYEVNNEIVINNCFGKRYIGAGAPAGQTIIINGVPGNALGAYLDGATIMVNGNAQDAVGDTMNDGKIVIHGNVGDVTGYAMRGGKIFIRGNAGYRTGIHMKQYRDKRPVIVVGGTTGSFLGEYLAGGLIIVLGLETENCPVGNFTGTGMHGGEIFLRTDSVPGNLPEQVITGVASREDMKKIKGVLEEYAGEFKLSIVEITSKTFYKLIPNARNPYRQLYTEN